MSLTGLCFLAALLHLWLLRTTALGWRRIARSRPAAARETPQLTVLTAARNEAANLPHWHAALKAQSLKPKRVILIDDRSEDETPALARGFTAVNSSFSFFSIKEKEEGWSPKKYALTQGIAAAPTDFLCLTDADCRPRAGWLHGMGEAFASGADLVLGYSPYRPSGRPLLDAMIAYETFHTAFLYLGDAAQGRPWMGVGRNIGYSRGWFKAQGGMERHREQLSGDDDLLVAHASPETKVEILTAPETWVESEAPAGWAAWFRQKRRHVSASAAYPRRTQLRVGALFFSQAFTVWGLVVAGFLAFSSMTLPVQQFVIFVLYLTGKKLLLREAARRLETRLGWAAAGKGEILLAAYGLIVAPLGWMRVTSWK